MKRTLSLIAANAATIFIVKALLGQCVVAFVGCKPIVTTDSLLILSGQKAMAGVFRPPGRNAPTGDLQARECNKELSRLSGSTGMTAHFH
jgi:hypothetical protein